MREKLIPGFWEERRASGVRYAGGPFPYFNFTFYHKYFGITVTKAFQLVFPLLLGLPMP